MKTEDINYEEVRNKVEQLDKCSRVMDELFGKFKETMNDIYEEDAFEGTASESFQSKYGELKPKLDNYVELVKSFAEKIEAACAKVEATEASIQRDANTLAH